MGGIKDVLEPGCKYNPPKSRASIKSALNYRLQASLCYSPLELLLITGVRLLIDFMKVVHSLEVARQPQNLPVRKWEHGGDASFQTILGFGRT
jgi:hypothetical protein